MEIDFAFFAADSRQPCPLVMLISTVELRPHDVKSEADINTGEVSFKYRIVFLKT